MDVDELGRLFPEATGISLLGAGGQKKVFGAFHSKHGSIVIKLIHENQDLERIQREIAAVEKINSSHVPCVLCRGTVVDSKGSQLVWLIEKRIHGQSLREALASGPLPYTNIPKLGRELLEALCDAEACRIVHRDIKPDNVMIDVHGDFWLLDFGIARHLDMRSLTATVNAWGIGTPGYAPPEQYRNQKDLISIRSDLFALGTTIYESITGFNPFTVGAKSVQEVLERIESKTVDFDPARFHGNTGLIDFLSTSMSARRNHRPSSAREALDWWLELFPQGAA